MFFRTLLQRLTFAYFILLALVIGAVSISTLNLYVAHLETQISYGMLAHAKLLENALLHRTDNLEDIATQYRQATAARITIISSDGRVLADTEENPKTMENHLDRPEVQQALKSGVGQSRRFSKTTQVWTKYVAKTIGGSAANGFVRIALPLDEIDTLKKAVIGQTMWVVALTAILTGIIVFLILRNLVRPIREMSHTSKRIASGDFSHRIQVTGAAEVRELAESFNSMAVDLSKLLSKLTSERNRIKAIMESMIDGVIACDKEGVLILINPAAEEIFQISQEEALNRHILEVIRNYELAAAFEEALTNNQDRKHELRLFAPREMIVTVQIRPVLAEDGIVQGAVATIHDITTLRSLEQIRTEFVSNVSHELKTPLTSIRGFSETLLEEDLDPETQHRFLDIINNEAKRLARLINDLLDLSRLEGQNVKLNITDVDIPSLVNRVAQLLETPARQKAIQIETNFPENFPSVQGDSDMFAQIFLNLLENAVKYSPEGGLINVTGSELLDSEAVQILVKDTGMGIPQKDLPRIFERFYRVDKARSRQLGGTGLGLAIVKHIIDRHNGKISVKSKVNKGTEFIITLPIKHSFES